MQGVGHGTSDDARLLDELDRLLARVPGRDASVAVLARSGEDPPARMLARLLAQARPRVRVLAVDGTQDPGRLHLALATRGRFDLLVDLTGPETDRAELFRRVFWHLRKGGALVVRHADTGTGTSPRDLVTRLVAVQRAAQQTAQLAAHQAGRPLGGGRRAGAELSLARAVATVTEAGPHLVVTSRARAFAVVREGEVNALLQTERPPRGELLARLPPARLRSRGTVADSPGAPGGVPVELDAPELSLRRYDQVRCLRGQVVVQGNLMLPDSFRHGYRRRLQNTFVNDRGPGFAVPRPSGRDSDELVLDGPYFHLDCEFRGHFGHALTDQLSRLWAWRQAREAEPDLKALLVKNRQHVLHPFEVALYGAMGIPAADLLLVDGPVRVERLLCATPMFSQPRYVHPAITAVWDEAARGLAAAAPERTYPDRIFLSRRTAKRSCHNAEEVEGLFAEHGFEVVFPEEHPLAEQARMFREAGVVGGFAGSGMFGILFSDAPKRVVLVSSDLYTAKNEHLIAAVRGHHVDTAWCRADLPRAPRGWMPDAFRAGFTFDHRREGAWLADRLRRL